MKVIHWCVAGMIFMVAIVCTVAFGPWTKQIGAGYSAPLHPYYTATTIKSLDSKEKPPLFKELW
jgi:hypothetical protein